MGSCPASPIMSSGESTMVRDLDLVSRTVMRPTQSSCCFLVCLFAFVVWFVFLVFFLGLHAGLRTGPLPVLLWLSTN